jgi:hypothetical protein
MNETKFTGENYLEKAPGIFWKRNNFDAQDLGEKIVLKSIRFCSVFSTDSSLLHIRTRTFPFLFLQGLLLEASKLVIEFLEGPHVYLDSYMLAFFGTRPHSLSVPTCGKERK